MKPKKGDLLIITNGRHVTMIKFIEWKYSWKVIYEGVDGREVEDGTHPDMYKYDSEKCDELLAAIKKVDDIIATMEKVER